MLKIKTLLILFLFLTSLVKAQDSFSKELTGVVSSKNGDVAATHVLNITTQKATITDINGYFNLQVSIKDSIEISAVHFKKKIIVITKEILESKLLRIPLEEAITKLEEVVVMPYSLSGDISKDLNNLDTEPVVTASTLGLPNAYVKIKSKAEKELYAATANPITSLDPLINAITGRTKMLKERVKRNKEYERTQRVRAFYKDSLFLTELKIPLEKIEDFMYFCEIDSRFQTTVDTHDRFKILAYLEKKSKIYRDNNKLD